MTSDDSFGDFELAGWEDEATAAEYDRRLSLVTIQSVEALLDDAGVKRGHKVLDVACGAGYVAAAAAQRGADSLGIDFSTAQVRLARNRYPSSPGQSINALRDAGFDSPKVRTVPQVWRSSDPDSLFAMMATGTVRAAATLREQTSDARKLIREAVRQAVSAYQRDREYEVPMPAVVAAAVKPLR
jgi:SAM-dependent methyltransferase